MIEPNSEARPIDLADHIHYGCLIPNWMQYAFGHSNYEAAKFLCPICGSAKMSVDPDEPASVFTERTHHFVDFQNGTVSEAFDSGKLTGCFSFMACLKCENGHRCQMDLNFEGHGSNAITFSVLLTKQEYVDLHPAEAQKWGDDEEWSDKLTRGEFLILFAGRTRANCFFCFFQRQYEFLWLKETHADLFEEAKGMEKDDYTFQPGFALRDLDDMNVCEVIFQRRVKDVCKIIFGRFQGRLFEGETDNELALTSCGLLCGK